MIQNVLYIFKKNLLINFLRIVLGIESKKELITSEKMRIIQINNRLTKEIEITN